MRQIGWIALLLCVLLACTSVNAAEITFLTHFIRPFSYEENDEFKGFAVDIVREMMKSMGHPEKFEMYPFPRALATVQEQPDFALFIVARNPERETTVKWVGPLVTNNVYFYKKKGSSVQVNTLDDVKNLPEERVGVGRGNADHTFLTAQGFTNLYPTSNQMQSLQMLANGRIDVTPMGEMVLMGMAQEAGINPEEFERTDVKLYPSILFLAFSNNVPDEIIAQWQQALDALKASGKYQEIYQQYIR